MERRRRRKEVQKENRDIYFYGYVLPPSKMNWENIIQRMQIMKAVGNGDHKERKYIKTTQCHIYGLVLWWWGSTKGWGGTAHPWARRKVCWGRWHRNWPLSDELDFPAAEGEREKRKKCLEWGEQTEQGLRDLGAQNMFGKKHSWHSGQRVTKGQRERVGGMILGLSQEPTVTKAKGKMTSESTCHPWHPLLATSSALLPNVSLLPARRTQFKARHIFLFSFSSCVNKKQISPLSYDHEPGLYNFRSGAGLCVWEKEVRGGRGSERLVGEGWAPNPDAVPYTLYNLDAWLKPQWSLKEYLPNSAYIAQFFSWLH